PKSPQSSRLATSELSQTKPESPAMDFPASTLSPLKLRLSLFCKGVQCLDPVFRWDRHFIRLALNGEPGLDIGVHAVLDGELCLLEADWAIGEHLVGEFSGCVQELLRRYDFRDDAIPVGFFSLHAL